MKIIKRFLIVIACLLISYYLTWTVDKITIESQLQYTFVFLYFFIVCHVICWFLLKHMRKFRPKQNAIRILVSCFLAVIVLVSFYDSFIEFYQPMKIKITALGDSVDLKEGQKGTEVWLIEVTADNKTIDFTDITLTEGWENREGSLLHYQNQTGSIVLEVPAAKNIWLTFVSHPWSGTVSVDNGNEVKEIELFNKYQNSTKIVSLSGIYKQNDMWETVLLAISCLMVLMVVLYLLLELILTPARVKQLKILFNKYTPKLYHKIIYLFLNLLTSFCFVASFTFLKYEQVFYLSMKNAFTFFTTALALGLLGTLFFNFIDNNRHMFLVSASREKNKSIFLMAFLITSLVWFVYLIAFFPGFMSPDCVCQQKFDPFANEFLTPQC